MSSRAPSQGPDLVDYTHPTARPSFTRPLISTLGWDLQSIIASSPNFYDVKRVHYSAPNARVDMVIQEVERDGNPLIINGWNRHPRWPKALFNIDWLRKNGDQNPTVRNVHSWVDLKITIDDFIKRLRETPAYASADEHERLYGKDGDCPAAWTEWLVQSGAIPDELLFHGPNDFLKFLPEEAKVQTLMCYMGIGDTFTPFHKDLCASSGQNLMCFSEHSGSAFWFMTKSSAAPRVAAYFHQLGQEVDLETHVVTIEELAKAPFDIYIAEQVLGDLVLIPPRSCHQVVNKGGITIKTSWSRMSLNGLQTALWHELPIYHRVCRQEIYKVKSNIFHALRHFIGLVEELPRYHEISSCPPPTENLKQLVCLFDDILATEVSISRDSMPHLSQSNDHTDNLHCDFCGADIFQSFFECDSCLPASSAASAGIVPVGGGLTLCPLCYVEGRTCCCGKMQPVQCRPFNDLLEIRDRAVRAIQRADVSYTNAYGYLSDGPLQLLAGRDANIFEAACKLLQKRQNDAKAMRSCRARAPHPVSASAAIYCKSCHGTRCYTHLLDSDSVHSVDAITLSDFHDGDANWHQAHRSSSQQYQGVRQRAIEDEERGSRPNVSHRLVYLAKTFTTCRAIEPEVTKHGWYDRFVQATSVPIAKSPAKTLVGLPDDIDSDEPRDGQVLDEFTSRDLAGPAPKGSDLQRTGSVEILSPASSRGMNGVQSPRLSDFVSLAVNQAPGTQHDMLKYTPPPSAGRPPSRSSVIVDDAGNLSDLTDLPTDLDSPSVSYFPPSAPVTPSDTQLATGLQSKTRLVLDYVAIPLPEWHNRRREKNPPSLQQKRKRASLLLSDTAGSPDIDNLPSCSQELPRGSPSKRKKKVLQGSASRLPRSKRVTLRVQTSPNDNHDLANALNQTFQLNRSSAAPHVTTAPLSSDPVLPVSGTVINPSVNPQYNHVGVQKNLNFTRNTSTSRPSEDLSGCILKLEAENRELRAQVETYKREREEYHENLGEIQRRYSSSGSFHRRSAPHSGLPNITPYVTRDFAHPRWRTRNATDHQTEDQEPEYPSIETLPLPTPSSPESVSPSTRRRTPTEPRNYRMRGRVGGDARHSRRQSYSGGQQHGRRRGPSEPSIGRRYKAQGLPSLGCNGRIASPPVPDTSETVDGREPEAAASPELT